MKIDKNFLMVSNYNADISWILDYTNDYIIYDRSDTNEWIKPFDQTKVIKVPNIGWDIYDKFTYIIDNYDQLPEAMIMTKGNIFKYISKKEFDEICNNSSFTPIFTKFHPTYMPISFYGEDGMYNEKNTSWYLRTLPIKYFTNYNEFIRLFNIKIPEYIKFAPGSNYIVTKANIHKHPVGFYEKLKEMISYCPTPGEAQILERFMYTMWTTDQTFMPEMLVLETKNPLVRLSHQILVLFTKNKILANLKKFIKLVINILRHFKNYINKPLEILNERKNKKDWLMPDEIKNYRKSIKVCDIFTYNGEADILEIRLNILKDSVDQFIIVEAPTTFSGIPKPLYFQEQKERFKPFLNKIKYFIIDDYPNDANICRLADSSSNVPNDGPEHWRREFYQKESIKKALTHLGGDDICFVGDVDEIWNPEILIDYSREEIFKLRQEVYVYYLNNKSSEDWAGTLVTKYKNIKNSCINHLRTKSKTSYVYLSKGGWHFTSMGGIEEVRRKLRDSYTSESYNTTLVQDNLKERFGKKDYLGRNFKFNVDERDLPKYILTNKAKYKHLLK